MFNDITDAETRQDASELPQNMEAKNLDLKIPDIVSDAISDKTEHCKTDEECGYPVHTCYEVDLVQDEGTGVDVKLKKCFVTWWFVLIIVVVALIVLICIISCIVVCCCKMCC